jgi:hypothetical protein
MPQRFPHRPLQHTSVVIERLRTLFSGLERLEERVEQAAESAAARDSARASISTTHLLDALVES